VASSRRRLIIRTVQYGVLAVVVLALAFGANWPQIAHGFFDPSVIGAQFPRVIEVALVNTIIYTVLGFAFGLALGVVLALMRLSEVPPYRWIATVYIEIFRGLPALLIFIVFGFGLPIAFGFRFTTLSTVTIALGLVGAAYMGETVRAGIQAVPKGQVEAARSLGMTRTRAMVSIVIPQAFRIILPPLTNELILLAKDSSLVYILGLTEAQVELTGFGRDQLDRYPTITPLIVSGLCYLIITIPLSQLSRYLERRASGRKEHALEVIA
jgi:polar amino acid transport system permease protein